MKNNKIKIKRGGLSLRKRGSLTLLGIIVVLVLGISASLFVANNSDNQLTGALIGVQTMKGECNISITEDVINIGHDYECENTDGFHIDADNITFDCQNHYIKCVSGACNQTGNLAGIRLNGRSGVTIQNCYIYNFTDGIKVEGSSNNTILQDNFLYNNSDGIDIHNSTATNVTGNMIDNNSVCGVNISNMNNALDSNTYNKIWNNRIFNGSNGIMPGSKEACNDLVSFNFWYLEETCGDFKNILSANSDAGGNCIAGNWWLSYNGRDTTGDGLGDTKLPYKGGGILIAGSSNIAGDKNPLVDPCVLPGVWKNNGTCPNKEIISDSGEGLAIVDNNVYYTCNGTLMDGNGSNQVPPYQDDMRGIEIIGVHDVTIVGCNIYNFTYGIYIQNAYNINLVNLTIHDNNHSGIYIGSLAYNVTIDNATIYDVQHSDINTQKYGVYLKSARPSGPGNNISNSNIYNNSFAGIYLGDNSDYNGIYYNKITNNSYGIFVNESDALSLYGNNISNNNESGIYFVASDNTASWGDATTLNNVYQNYEGITFNHSGSDAEVKARVYNNTIGLYSLDSTFNIKGAILYNNSISILLNYSDNIYIDNTNISGSGSNSSRGIYALYSSGLKLSSALNNYISGNEFGILLNHSNWSTIGDRAYGGITYLQNNNVSISLLDTHNTTISGVVAFDGEIGLNLTNSSSNTFYNNNFTNFTTYNILISNQSNYNLFYNNLIYNNLGGIAAEDVGNNTWNTTYNCTSGNSIIETSCIGGNYWSNYSGTDTNNDGIGDEPSSYNITGLNNTDFLPLTKNFVGCGDIGISVTFTADVLSNGSCLNITADNITLDFAGNSLIGNGSGIGINISNRQGVNIVNGTITNFTTGIYVDPSWGINISYNNISANTIGVNFTETNDSFIYHNRFRDNNLGLSLTDSYNNLIYDNIFNNTDNAQDNGCINQWNTSYVVTLDGVNDVNVTIIESEHFGGNFWSNYLGTDFGSGTYPYNTSGDNIGDTHIPYTNNNKITGGDYLPLTNNTGAETLNCQSITTSTTLQGNVSCPTGDGIVIAADNVVLDCNGKNVSGGGTGAGISVDGYDNVVIKNCNITNFYYGIKVLNAQNTQIIEDNNLKYNDFYGIYLYQATHTLIQGNELIDDNNGVYLIKSTNTTISNNTINLQKKFYGVYAFDSRDNFIEGNMLWDNYHGIYLVNSSTTNVTNNNITSSDVYSLFVHKGTTDSYFQGNNLTLGQEAIRIKENSNNNYFIDNQIFNHLNYGIYSTGSNNNDFVNNTIVNNSRNMYLVSSTNSLIENNTIGLGIIGIQALNNSDNINLTRNIINSTNFPSLEINNSANIILANNTIINNTYLYNVDGARIEQNNSINDILNITASDNLTIVDNSLQTLSVHNANGSIIARNIITNKLVTVVFSSGNVSANNIKNSNLTVFVLETVTNSNIHDNDAQNNTQGILLFGSSTGNTIFNNWLKDNVVGLNISSSISNTIYNNYFENTNNVEDDGDNAWNTSYSCQEPNVVGGPCKGGNFYSDYYGLDNGLGGLNEQGDGIGDQPSIYTITGSTIDSYPLVLYVARQYYDMSSGTFPDYSALFDAYGNVSGLLTNAEVVPNAVQTINYNDTTTKKAYLELIGQFNQSDVHAETLKLDYNQNKTRVNISGVTGITSSYSVYLYHNNQLDSGVYVCENAYNLSLDQTCSSVVPLNISGDTGAYTLNHQDNYYKVSGLTNQSVTVGVNKAFSCGGNVLHDVTFTADVNCTGDAFVIRANNVTIDLNGYSLIGSGTGIGINISSYNYTVIKDGDIINFTVGVYADPAKGINITNSNLSGNYVGVEMFLINDSFIVSNNIYNNSIGINLTSSYSNLIYNNFFNNTINAIDNGSNTWNISLTSGTNIIGGSNLGGNSWNNYTGWDTNLNGIGDTLNESIRSSAGTINGTDQLPLTAVGKIACGNINKNITLGQNVAATGTCFNFTNQLSLVFDCAGYSIIGSANGLGLNLTDTNLSIIRNCTVKNFSLGIFTGDSHNNTIIRNTIINNTWGINLTSSGNNTIYNNFFNNTNNVADDVLNIWNRSKTAGTSIAGGSYLGGNYWSNYNGSDTDSDKIGNTDLPYNNSGNITGAGDYLPLIYTVSVASTPATPATTSPSGGGGGGGGSTKKVTVIKENCTQNWQCGEWSKCIGGEQFRNCNDVNLCESKDSAGTIDQLFEKTKPSESRSCEMPIVPEVQEPIVEEPSFISEFIPDSTAGKAITLSSLALLMAVGGIFVYWQFAYTPTRLRRRLRRLRPLLGEETAEILKSGYLGVYHLYLKLSEKHKQNFYGKVTKVRETIEEQLKAEKKIEELLEEEHKGGIKEQKERYLDIYHQYRKLPRKVKHKYYQHVVHLRERLERGN
jgi:parallel beta-helix repeat protein